MSAPRFLLRLMEYKKIFLFVGFAVSGLLQYHMFRGLDSDLNNHLDVVEPNRIKQIDSTKTPTDRKRALGLLKRAPSIDYFACCGAGHRLSKLADAYYLAKELEFVIRIFFGYCGQQEVFSYLFGPRPMNEAQVLDKIEADIRVGKDMVKKPDMYFKVSNDVRGFRKFRRTGGPGPKNTTTCPCLGSRLNRFDSDVELFSDLRDKRFRGRHQLDAFRNQFFRGHTVIGLHIRAGNGETGDFERKKRMIQDIDQWCLSISRLLISMSENFKENEPPLLFVASDTHVIISKLRATLEGKMEVIDFEQGRIDHGQGVLFGAASDVTQGGDQCKDGWVSSFSDMMLLSHTDVVVAGRPSSFTQSLPMTLALTTPKSKRKVLKSFCEVDRNATTLMCFEDIEDWCCNGETSFSLGGTPQNMEYRRLPPVEGLDIDKYMKSLEIRPHGRDSCVPGEKNICLPYEFPNEKEVKRIMRKRGERKAG